MRMIAAAALAWFTLASPAFAQPGAPLPAGTEPSPLPAAPSPQASVSPRPARPSSLYATATYGVGVMVKTAATSSDVSNLHGSLGVQVGPEAGVNYRLGLAVDVFPGYGRSIAIGVETQIDHPIASAVRLGGRASLSLSSESRLVWGGGMRLRHRVGSLGVDLIRFGPTGTSEGGVGVIGSIGLEGKAAKYALVVGAVGAVLLLGALSQEGT